MNVVQFGANGCEKVRRYLDSYLSGELLVETNHEVLRHLETCASCTKELEARSRLRGQLKQAVRDEPAPPYLEQKIRTAIRGEGSRKFSFPWGARWALAAAVVMVAVMGGWFALQQPVVLSEMNPAAQDSYIAKVSTRLVGVLRVGYGDHLHCSVARKKMPAPGAVLTAEQQLGKDYQGLEPLVRAAVPGEFQMVMVHRCGYLGRRFVHLSLRRPDGKLLSVVVARKETGESFLRDQIVPALRASGLPIYQQGSGGYQVAGFETRDHLAYVVSDLPAVGNLQLASRVAPALRDFLARLEG